MAKIEQKASVKTNTKSDSVCKVDAQAVKFSDLWDAYKGGKPVDKKHEKDVLDDKGKVIHKKGDYVYGDQCAARVSVAIHGVGVDMKSFKGFSEQVNGKKAAMRAQELADWLKKQPFCGLPQKPENVKGSDWQEKIKGRTGILFFANYWLRSNEKSPTGDHIDLWNGSRLTTGSGGFAGILTTLARFGLGMETGLSETDYGWSDLGKSTEILFWEIP
jgi:hypothetical protein